MSRIAGMYVGQSVARVEDDRILTGKGRYVDDIKLARMVHAVFVRSSVAHAKLVSVNAERARAMPGVLAVLTAEDLVDHVTPLQLRAQTPDLIRPVFWPLTRDKVRFVGDPIALVVAESRYLAEDARDAVEVEYDFLEPINGIPAARKGDRPPVFDEAPDNVMLREQRDFGDVDANFAKADRIIHHRFKQARLTPVPIETRGLVADYEPRTDEFTIHDACQGPHLVRGELALVLSHPADRIRVISPDVGGAFGQKGVVGREEPAVAVAAKLLGRPVKWIEDRMENLTSAPQARDEEVELAIAVKQDGEILGYDVQVRIDQGSYTATIYHAGFLAAKIRTLFQGPYRLRALRWNLELYATNKPTYGPYRGPWAAETLFRETGINVVARELGLDPNDVRRRNLFTLEEQPTKLLTGPTVEGVTALESLRLAEQAADLPAFRRRQREGRARGLLLGVGFSTFMEGTPGPPDFNPAIGFSLAFPEPATVQLEQDGRVTILIGQNPHGQGHVTTMRQVAAEELGIPMEQINIVYGDSSIAPYHAMGTGGSRAASQAGGVVMHASRTMRTQLFEYAGQLLEISPEDLEIADGSVVPVGSPTLAMPLSQLGRMTYTTALPDGMRPGLRTTVQFGGPEHGGWTLATHACFVAVDAETGIVKVERYIVAEDCGTVINPGIVDGQIRGGVAQGIGQVLLEHSSYDEYGNPGAATFVEYLLPTATDVPRIETIHMDSEPLDEVNFRGVGEGGLINTPPALINAISDALGGQSLQVLPLTPERLLGVIDSMDGIEEIRRAL